jgi:hypothetical protein
LESDPRYQPFETGWSSVLEAMAHLYTGRIDPVVEIFTALARQPRFAHVGLNGRTSALPAVGRSGEAMLIADEALAAARAHGNPFWIAFAFNGYVRAFTETDPVRALDTSRQGLVYVREHRVPLWEAVIARDCAVLEAVHGDLEQGLVLFDTTIDSYHQAGNVAQLPGTLAKLATFFDRFERLEIAATIYGASTHQGSVIMVVNLPSVAAHLRTALGAARFDQCVAVGAAMDLSEAVRYAREQIRLARAELVGASSPPPNSGRRDPRLDAGMTL